MSDKDSNDAADESEVVAGVTAEPQAHVEEMATELGLDADEVHDQFGHDDEIEAGVAAAGEGSAVVSAVAEAGEDGGDRRAAAAYGGWAYLTFLFALFLALALIAYACDDDDSSADSSLDAPVTTTTEAATSALTPVELEFSVDGDQVTLRGAVPDEGARAQLVELAIARYGDENVVDELTIDPGTTFTDGTVSVVGTTVVGDDGPEGLQADVTLALELTGSAFDVSFEEIELTPIDVEAAVATASVTLSGVVPDQETVDGMVVAAAGIWGPTNVDGSGLMVDPLYTMAGGTVRITGTSDAGDTRVAEFAAVVGSAYGVTVDNQSEVDTSSDALARLEERLREALAANPINFATGSAEIDPSSDAILEEVAAVINATPGVPVEVVGHTDDQGAAEANQELSEARAQAVVDRLVELGVDADRLTARGAGEEEPIAENDTAEGRAQNRRIAFEFEGAGDEDGEEATSDETADEESE